jgi:uncharacterized protein
VQVKVERYEANVPSWVDLSTEDVAKAVAFFSELFGWDCQDMGEEAGHYHLCTKNGEQVAGIGPLMSPGPAHWTTYVNVESADATTAKVEASKGGVLMGPMDVMEAGRMAIFADPSGAAIGIWQPNQHLGATLVNEPGSWTWSNLLTRDVGASNDFYGDVFSWAVAEETSMDPPGFVYSVSGRAIASATPMPDVMPPATPSYWDVIFAVADADATADEVRRLGGSVVMGPEDMPPGRIGSGLDPAGTVFTWIGMRSD